jgi:hypothetical protein
MNIDAMAVRRIRWVVARWWHGPGARMSVWVLGLCAALAAVAAWHAALQAGAERDAVASEVAVLRSQPPAPAAVSKADARAGDFTATLPAKASAAQALEVLQSAAARTQVAVESVQVQDMPATEERLGRVELVVTARGSYADLKRWLAEVTERVPGSTIARLQLQRQEGTPQVQAQLVVVAWSQPEVSSASLPDRR